MPSGIRLVVGLGNPGEAYQGTRHNVGFRAVDGFVESAGGAWKRSPVGRGLTSRLAFPDRVVTAAKPHTFMNLSGEMVSGLARYHGVGPGEILVVCDDFSLPLGRLRIRQRGSAGGQNGLESVIDRLGTQEVPRLRLGIGPVPPGQDSAAFVLSRFPAAERKEVDSMVERAAGAIRAVLEDGLEPAMNAFNPSES
ncbi:MAG: aminoacyl-tRNA hydrolase [Elusimicrobiota bacterium]